MKAILITFFAAVLLQFKRSTENESPKKDEFLEMLAKAKPRKRPDDLFNIINSPLLSHYDEIDLVNLVLDGIQTYIRPNMGEEEVIHVRSTLLKPLGQLVSLQSDRLYGGQNGQQSKT